MTMTLTSRTTTHRTKTCNTTVEILLETNLPARLGGRRLMVCTSNEKSVKVKTTFFALLMYRAILPVHKHHSLQPVLVISGLV